MSIRSAHLLLLPCLLLLGCGGFGPADEPVSLRPAGIDASVTLPTGGKVKKGRSGGVRVEWAGFSFIASFELDRDRPAPVRSAVAADPFGTYEGSVAVTVAGVG